MWLCILFVLNNWMSSHIVSQNHQGSFALCIPICRLVKQKRWHIYSVVNCDLYLDTVPHQIKEYVNKYNFDGKKIRHAFQKKVHDVTKKITLFNSMQSSKIWWNFYIPLKKNERMKFIVNTSVVGIKRGTADNPNTARTSCILHSER